MLELTVDGLMLEVPGGLIMPTEPGSRWRPQSSSAGSSEARTAVVERATKWRCASDIHTLKGASNGGEAC